MSDERNKQNYSKLIMQQKMIIIWSATIRPHKFSIKTWGRGARTGTPLQEQERWGLQYDLIAASEGRNQHWPHKAKPTTRYSQNAFHRGQYANFSKAANGSSGVVFQIQEGTGSDYVAEAWTALRAVIMSGQRTLLDLLDRSITLTEPHSLVSTAQAP